jgi:hypothetical protein
MAATRNRAAVSGIVLALEEAFAAIQRKYPSVARNITIVVASKGRRDAFGYHAPQRWDLGKSGQVAELLIAAEYLQRKPREIFTTLLHEAVHSAAFALEIQDTSQNGRYHNRRFAQLATGMGLVVEKVPDFRGHNTPDIDADTAKEFSETIRNIGKATKMFRHADIEVRKGPNKNLLKAVCDCEDNQSIRASRARIEKGIACAECETLFEAAGQ